MLWYFNEPQWENNVLMILQGSFMDNKHVNVRFIIFTIVISAKILKLSALNNVTLSIVSIYIKRYTIFKFWLLVYCIKPFIAFSFSEIMDTKNPILYLSLIQHRFFSTSLRNMVTSKIMVILLKIERGVYIPLEWWYVARHHLPFLKLYNLTSFVSRSSYDSTFLELYPMDTT